MLSFGFIPYFQTFFVWSIFSSFQIWPELVQIWTDLERSQNWRGTGQIWAKTGVSTREKHAFLRNIPFEELRTLRSELPCFTSLNMPKNRFDLRSGEKLTLYIGLERPLLNLQTKTLTCDFRRGVCLETRCSQPRCSLQQLTHLWPYFPLRRWIFAADGPSRPHLLMICKSTVTVTTKVYSVVEQLLRSMSAWVVSDEFHPLVLLTLWIT